MIQPGTPAGEMIFNNGETYNIEWNYDEEAKLLTQDYNGGYIDFYGTKLEKIYYYRYGIYPSFIDIKPQKGDEYLIGFDDNKDCSDMDSNYYIDEMPNTIYACWRKNPDGLYLNGELYQGNQDDCFIQKNNVYMDNYYEDKYFSIETFGEGTDFSIHLNDDMFKIEYPLIRKQVASSIPRLNNIKIVSNGETILEVFENEIIDTDYIQSYDISNPTKRHTFMNYFQTIYDKNGLGQCPDICQYHACAE